MIYSDDRNGANGHILCGAYRYGNARAASPGSYRNLLMSTAFHYFFVSRFEAIPVLRIVLIVVARRFFNTAFAFANVDLQFHISTCTCSFVAITFDDVTSHDTLNRDERRTRTGQDLTCIEDETRDCREWRFKNSISVRKLS